MTHRNRNRYKASLLDLEASESDGGHERDSPGHSSDATAAENPDAFLKFLQLPTEVRFRIWESFCPDLTARGRFFEFKIVSSPGRHAQHDVWESAVLERQTAPTRAVFSTCAESRILAMRSLPDLLKFRRGQACVHFNKETDIVSLDMTGQGLDFEHPRFKPGDRSFAGQIINLSIIPLRPLDMRNFFSYSFSTTLPQLKKLFVCLNQDDEGSSASLAWCGSKSTHHYYIQTEEQEPGLGDDYECAICWSEDEKVRRVLKEYTPIGDYEICTLEDTFAGADISDYQDDYPEDQINTLKQFLKGVQVFPLARFEFAGGMELYNELLEEGSTAATDRSDHGTSDEPSISEHDSYESEGIDDSEIEEASTDEEDDDLAVLPLSDEEVSRDDASGNGASDVDPGDDGSPHVPAGHSSIPAPIVLSGSDGEGEEGPVPVRGRRGARIVVSDSDEETEKGPLPAQGSRRRGARAVVSESEDEDEVQTGTPPAQGLKGRTAQTSLSDLEENTSVSEDPEDEEGQEEGSRHISLAERLGAHRRANPVASDSDVASSSPLTHDEPSHGEEGEDEERPHGAEEWDDGEARTSEEEE